MTRTWSRAANGISPPFKRPAWNFTTGLSNVIVAVLDSGIDASHPDLAGRILPGYDFLDNTNNTSDDFGHGTAVSGTIVAEGNNGLGVAGVAYSTRLLPVKVMDSSGFAYSCIAEGIRSAVDQGARVINISIAGDSPSSVLQDAIHYAWSNNVIVVAAAGNNANNTPNTRRRATASSECPPPNRTIRWPGFPVTAVSSACPPRRHHLDNPG